MLIWSRAGACNGWLRLKWSQPAQGFHLRTHPPISPNLHEKKIAIPQAEAELQNTRTNAALTTALRMIQNKKLEIARLVGTTQVLTQQNEPSVRASDRKLYEMLHADLVEAADSLKKAEEATTALVIGKQALGWMNQKTDYLQSLAGSMEDLKSHQGSLGILL